MCFFAGGLSFSEQGFGLGMAFAIAFTHTDWIIESKVAAQMNSSLLTISVIAVLLPGAFLMTLSGTSTYDSTSVKKHILEMSHGVCSPPFDANKYI